MDDNLLRKLRRIRNYLNAAFIERQSEVDGILCTLLAKSNCLFIGAAGTAKTKLIVTASELLGVRVFDTLLSETTKPDSVFGPIDVPALAKGIQRNKIATYAPDCEVIFFDEIFKASGVVLNPLLWLINEHRFRNGDEGIINCPTMSVFGASNEIPTDPTLKPMYDRFVMRFKVDFIRSEQNMLRMMKQSLYPLEKGPPDPFTKAELIKLQEMTKKVKFSAEMGQHVLTIKNQLYRATGVVVGDRRVVMALPLIKAHAFLHGRDEVDISDMEILANIFWDTLESVGKTRAIVLSNATSGMSDILSYEDVAESIWTTALKSGEMEIAERKLSRLVKSVSKFKSPLGMRIKDFVKERHELAKRTLNQRNEFIVLRVEEKGKIIYKLSVATSVVWTPDQLRLAGFHWRIKSQYWWCEGPSGSLQRRVAFKERFKKRIKTKLGVEPLIRSLS